MAKRGSKTGSIAGIAIELTVENTSIVQAWKEVNSELSSTQRSLKDVEKLLKIDPENTNMLAQKQAYLNTAIEETKKKLQEEKNLLEALKSSDNADKTTEQQRALERQIERTNKQLDSYENEAREMEAANKQISDSTTKADEEMSKIATTVDSLSKSLAQSGIADKSKEIYDALMQCVEVADRYETALAKVQSIAQADSNALGAMSSKMKTYSTELGVSYTDLAEATYQAISAGVDTANAVDFAAQATKLAMGGFTEASKAVDVVTTALNAYGLSADEAGHIMDDLITTQNLGKITVDELAQGLGRVIPTAAAFEVNFDNLSTALAELTKKGVPARQAITYLGSMLSELGDSGSGVSKILREQTGQSFADLMSSGNSLGDVMGILMESVEGDKTAFMNLWGQTTAATAAFDLAQDKGEEFNNILNSMQTSAGAAESAFSTMADTSENADRRFKAALENMQASAGQQLQPVIDRVKELGTEALQQVTDFIDEHPQFVAALEGAAIGVAGVATAVVTASVAIAALKAAFGDLSGIAGLLVGAIGVGGAAGAIGAIALTAKDSETEVQNLCKRMDELDQQLDQSAADREFKWAEFDKETEQIGKLTESLKQLDGKTDLTDQEQRKLKETVDKLNQVMPDLNLQIDEHTGHLTDNSKAILDNVEAYRALARAQAAQEDYNKVIAEQFQNDMAYAEAMEERAAATDRLTIATNAYNEAKRAVDNNEIVADWHGINEEYYAAQENLDAINEKIKENRENNAALNSELEKYETYISGASEATRELAGAQEEGAATTVQWSKEIVDAYNKAQEAAYKSLEGQRDKFAELEKQQGESLDSMQQKFDDQIAGMQEWAEMVAQAALLMEADPNSTGLLSSLVSQGPDAAASLRALLDAATGDTESLQQFIDICNSFNETESLLTTISEMQGAIETGYTEPLDNAIQATLDKPTEINANLQAGYEQSQSDAEAFQETMTALYTDTATAAQEAIEAANEPTVAAAKELIDAIIAEAYAGLGIAEEGGQSTVFYNMGFYSIDGSLAKGITDGSPQVAAALQGVINNAVSSAMQSINRQLGEQMAGG